MAAYPGNTVPQNSDNLELTVKKILDGLNTGTWTGGGGGSGSTTDSNLPYGADEQVLTNVVGGPGPTVIVYKKAGATVKTRTLTYTGSGPTDVLTRTVDT